METIPTAETELKTWEDEGGSFVSEEPPSESVDERPTSSAILEPADPALKVETRASLNRESVALLDGGQQAYPRMLSAILQARSSIDLEVYAFSHRGVGQLFIDALGEASARGVRVDVVIDGWGSARSGAGVAATLRQAGCRARVFHRLLAVLTGRVGRNHRKILLVDDEIAFLGGINIGDENLSEGTRVGWADVALEIHGPQCAQLGAMLRRQQLTIVQSSFRILLSGIGGGWRLRRHYLKAFEGARNRIDLAHGYFLPDRGIVRALVGAVQRGVRVRLLLAGRSDMPLVRAATRRLYAQLLSAGVSIFEWEGSVLHAKVAAIDTERLLVGSFNLDPFSLANLETLVEVEDLAVAKLGADWIGSRMERARAITFEETSSFIWRWFFDPLGHLVARIADAIGRIIAGRTRRRAARDYSVSVRAPRDVPKMRTKAETNVSSNWAPCRKLSDAKKRGSTAL